MRYISNTIPTPQTQIYDITPARKTQRSQWKGGKKDYKSQRNEFTVSYVS